MPRPSTKEELINAVILEWDIMWNIIGMMDETQKQAEFNFGDDLKLKEAHWKRDKVVRDILIHLFEWHRLLIDWISTNLSGEQKAFLPSLYTWKTYGEMNVEFFNKHQSTSLAKAVEILQNSHNEVMELLDTFSEEALFVKKYYPWVGTSNLGSYFISVTSSHYDWAIKKLKLHNKTYLG